jgi:hypothetical protein
MARTRSYVSRHSLSCAAVGILLLWIVLYSLSSPRTHIGSFYGNAIADWTGVVVTVIASQYLHEKGSPQSRNPPVVLSPHREWLRNHSLTIFLLVTGAAWIAVYVLVDSESKWGQVVGNIVSEWTQIFGLVLLTKRLKEPGSKESAR